MSMERIRSLVFLLIILINSVSAEEDDVKLSLIGFLRTLSNNKQDLDWNQSSDPCLDGWTGTTCNKRTNSVRMIDLEGFGLDGLIDASLLCKARSLVVVSLAKNNLRGDLPPEIGNCTQLTHLYLGSNSLSGAIPSSLPGLNNLKRLDISNNNFSGELPDLPAISGLVSFLAQNNRLEGTIPQFDFANLGQFNVSNNKFTGPIPNGVDRFGETSLSGNAGLCGKPLLNACPPAPSAMEKSKSPSTEKAIMYSGYIILGLAFILFFIYMLVCKKKKKMGAKDESGDKGNKRKMKKISDGNEKVSSGSSGYKTSRSEYSIGTSSNDSAGASASLVVLKNPTTKELRFEELLKAPAELLARGRLGSLYKVMFDDENTLAVKRIKDPVVSSVEFHKRMERIDRISHPNVLPLVAFYCSKQEKLVVYEYQQNGSLFKLIHGSQEGRAFDWVSRLNVAAAVADGLAFMHRELNNDGIGHGSLKSSNILMDKNMDPCISEYGIISRAKQSSPALSSSNSAMIKSMEPTVEGNFKADVYGFGIVLLELLTGKLVQNNGFDLPSWVHSVVREEWTVEVFDKTLTADGASEERMVHLLQLALKCIDSSPGDRPSMSQVATMINTIREEEDRSNGSEA